MKAIETREDAINFIHGCILFIGPGFNPDTPMGGYVTGNDFPLLNTGAAIHYTHLLADCHDMLGEDIYQVGLEFMRKMGYAPAIDLAEMDPDWQSEVEAFDKKAMEALNWVYDAIKGDTVQVEFIDQKGVFTDSVRWTGHVVHLAHGHRIANYHEQMSHYDKIRVAAAVQKAIAERTELDSPPDGPEADHRSQYLGDGFTDQVYERLAEEESLDEEAERGTKP